METSHTKKKLTALENCERWITYKLSRIGYDENSIDIMCYAFQEGCSYTIEDHPETDVKKEAREFVKRMRSKFIKHKRSKSFSTRKKW